MSTLARFMRSEHKAAARCLGYGLTDPATWPAASAVWAARLTPPERAALAWAALKALDPQDTERTLHAALGGAGMPIAPFLDHRDEASFWADMASAEELEAYCLASFRNMPRGRQVAFLAYVQRRVAA